MRPRKAPVHFLVIPKNRDGLTQLCKAEDRHEAVLGRLMFVAQKMAKELASRRENLYCFLPDCACSLLFPPLGIVYGSRFHVVFSTRY